MDEYKGRVHDSHSKVYDDYLKRKTDTSDKQIQTMYKTVIANERIRLLSTARNDGFGFELYCSHKNGKSLICIIMHQM